MRRLRQEADVVERDVVAVEGDGIVAPRGAQQIDDLVHAGTAIREVVAQRGVLGRRPAHAEAGDHPAAGQCIDRSKRVRQLQWVVHRRDQHARAEADTARRGRTPRERDERVEQVRRRIRLRRRMHDVVAHPDVGEAELLGVLGGAGDRLGSRAPAVLRQVDPDAHRQPP
jgi:hypothetical protein